MKQLGDKVLSKIENLITQIEKQKPVSKQSKTANKSIVVTKGKSSVLKEQTEVQKEQTALLPKKQNVSPDLDKTVNNHNVSLTQSEHIAIRQMSYGYIKKEKKNLSKLTTEAYKVEYPFQTFKVTNKHSLWLLKQKNIKPIYDRLDQISTKKKVKMHLLQQEQEKEQDRSMVPCFSDRYTAEDILKKYRKMNDLELKQFRQEYDEKNHERLKKLHCKQLNRIEKEVSEAIPTIRSNSRSLSKLRNIKKNYSEDVFKRLNQDQIDRRGRKKELVNRIVEEEGGFQPVLCSKSRVLVERSKNKHSFSTHEMSSHHNKCKTPPVHSPFKKKIKKQSPQPKQSVDKTPQKIENFKNLKLPAKKHSQKSKKSDKITQKSSQRKSITPSKPESDKNRLLNVLKDKDNLSTQIKYDGFLGDGEKTPTKKSFKGERSVPFDIPKQQRHLYTNQHKPNCPYHEYKANKDKSPIPFPHEQQPKWPKSSKK